ncbi:MAG: hypothetical protein GQ574_26680 [Crocinitomix sp.]|nr:hypothetical protein [Crocinitomix sp.]
MTIVFSLNVPLLWKLKNDFYTHPKSIKSNPTDMPFKTIFFLLSINLFLICFNSYAQTKHNPGGEAVSVPLGDGELFPYADIITTPLMGYTISPRGSNIPTHFLIANGLKANLGIEVGLLYPVFTTTGNARAFISGGYSSHFIGFEYGGAIINIGGNTISNHRHTRFFFGAKFIPIKQLKFLSLGASFGYGTIKANFSTKNINGKIKARAGDVSFSLSFGINHFVN